MKKIDAIDRHILKILQQEGRLSNAALSQRVNLSPTPCLERVRKLEKNGYITGYTARLDPAKLDCAFVTFVTVDLDRTNEDVFDNFAKSVRNISEITECHMVGGGFDYLLKIRTASMAAFRKFYSEQLMALPEVAQTNSYFVMEDVKSSNLMPIK